MKLNKLKKLLLTLASGSLVATATSLCIVSCNNPTTYNVTFNTPDHLTWTQTVTSVTSGSDLKMTYTLEDGYEIDEDQSSITSSGNEIKTFCNYANETISIPSTKIIGEININLVTKTSVVYTVNYNTPANLTWNTTCSSVKSGKTITMTYELASGWAIDATQSKITSNEVEIQNSIDYRYGIISIPSSKITGNVVINLVLKTAAVYTVTYETDTNLTWLSSNPQQATEGNNFTAGYTLVSGYEIDTSASTVTSGGTDITQYVSFSNGTIIIPGQYITGNIVIKPVTKEYTSSMQHSEPVGGTWKTKTDTATGVTTATLACNESNGEMSITLSGTWQDAALKIASSGTYNITLDNWTIYNKNVEVIEEGVNIAPAPINITRKANGAIVNFILKDGSENNINDLRSKDSTYELDEDFVVRHNSQDGTGSLNFKGNGVLNINNINNNKGSNSKAIQTKTDVTISNGCTINAFAYDTCIQVGGKLTIDNANVLADSYYDDGIKTKALEAKDDLTLTNKNINRDIVIKGKSQVTIYSARNGIASAHDFITQTDSNGSPTISVYTNTQASSAKSGSVGTVALDEQNMFIQVPSSIIKSYPIANYYYTIDFYANNTSGDITSTEYMTLKKIHDTNGYFFKCDRPLSSEGLYFKLNIFNKDQYGAETPSATATSGYIKTISTPTKTDTYDCVAISSISGSTISMGGSSLNKNYKYLVKGEKQTIDTTIGSKGIKVNNEITINAGTINIKSVDTCMSASYGDMYCKSSTAGDVTFGTGNITFNGGSLTGYSYESDGVKAYGEINVKGGEINITNAAEALEAPVLNISGGITKLYATDDGLNASTAGTHTTTQLNISISGGVLDVQTGSGDCDAIDSNNTITITGGLLVSRVPDSGSAMSLDWGDDVSNVSVTGTATVILLGNTEADGMRGPGSNKSITTTGTDYTSSISTSTACASGNHVVTYYVTSSSKSTYTYNNKSPMNSSKVRVWSCAGQVKIG